MVTGWWKTYKEIENTIPSSLPFWAHSRAALAIHCLRILKDADVTINYIQKNEYSVVFAYRIVDKKVVDAYRELFIPEGIYFGECVIHSLIRPKFKEGWKYAFKKVYGIQLP